MRFSLTWKGLVPLLSLNSRALRARSPGWRIQGTFNVRLFTSYLRRSLPHKYDKQLGRDSIRIFTLDPGRLGNELCGTLHTHPIKATPKYEALSYVWGPPDRIKAIKCNGQDLNITDGLDTALRRLRLPGEPRHIWIDQICIDQDSITESSEQVSIMRHIYSDAELVNAWLGPADPDAAASAAGIISTLANPKPLLHEKDIFPEDHELLDLGLPTRDSPAWDALNTVLSAPYSSRVWIIQEVAFASDFALLWGGLFWLWTTLYETWRCCLCSVWRENAICHTADGGCKSVVISWARLCTWADGW